MQSDILNLLCHQQKLTYFLADSQFTIVTQGGHIIKPAQAENMPVSLFKSLPELQEYETSLQAVLNNLLPKFELANLKHTQFDEKKGFLHLTVLRYLSENMNQPLLLIILAENTDLTPLQQALTERTHELDLLKKELVDTKQCLELILHRYVPKEVGKALLENRINHDLGGEVRRITVLFADLRNYTSISENLTPTETIDMLHICLEIASTAIAEAGGVIVNFMGDAVMALFNAPNDQIDHAKRAVRAGLTMQAIATHYQENRNLDKETQPIYFGVGINTGLALVGNVGAQWHYQYTAIGDTINVASRICSQAHPGEVLIGTSTYNYVKENVTAHQLAPMKFKGKSKEVIVYKIFDLAENSVSRSR